jgi:hypothetical protein
MVYVGGPIECEKRDMGKWWGELTPELPSSVSTTWLRDLAGVYGTRNMLVMKSLHVLLVSARIVFTELAHKVCRKNCSAQTRHALCTVRFYMTR